MADEQKNVSFTYNPGPGDPEIIRTLNHTFVAGEAVEFPEDHPNVAKLRGNRFFSEEGRGEEKAPAFDERQAKTNISAEKKIDGRTREAREARQKAEEAVRDAEARERSLDMSRRSMGSLSDAERRAMDQIRGTQGDDGEPVPGEPGWGGQTNASAVPSPSEGGPRVNATLTPDNASRAVGAPS